MQCGTILPCRSYIFSTNGSANLQFHLLCSMHILIAQSKFTFRSNSETIIIIIIYWISTCGKQFV
jgi:hypothetical protein